MADNTYGNNNTDSRYNNLKGSIAKKPKVAVALQYNKGEQAPKILATGKGYLADKIIEKAKDSDVPTYEDSKLADTLSNLEIGDMIPPELYTIVAEILVFVDKTDKLRGKIRG